MHLFEGDDDVVALIPFSWALLGLVVITAIVTVLSEWLVGSIDGFCEEFSLGRSFVGVIILPIVGNAVEHISAVSVAMKNKMDLALGVALGSAVQIALFVLPMVVVVGWFTGRDMSMKFPPLEVYLYLLSVIIVSLCLSNTRSNWLEGSLLVFTYAVIAIGIYFEKDVV
jgi:Ca2+:H+ antiporter